jgi:ATP-dependent Lon protease
MATSLVSALTKVAVRHDLAMTGEVTLRGRILPIGGLKEKVLAAHRGGIKTVLIPAENEKDIKEIPPPILRSITIRLVDHMDQVLRQALVLDRPDDFLRKPMAAEVPVPPPPFEAPAAETDVVTH